MIDVLMNNGYKYYYLYLVNALDFQQNLKNQYLLSYYDYE